MEERQANDTRRLIGLVLIVVAVLWLATTGLCTLGFLWFVIQSYDLMSSDMMLVMMFAVPSVLIGLGLYALGRRLRQP